MFRNLILTPLFSFLCLFVLPILIFAQGTTSRVTGIVTDNSGSVVSGATVTLTNQGTNFSLTTETNDSGVYTFDLLQVGTYQVSVEKQGFKKFISTGNTININQPATVNITLEIGDVSAVVTVENTAEQVQTSTSGNVGTTIDRQSLESAPIVGSRGRNPLSLMIFQPGVSTAGTPGGVHVHGSRDRAFNYTLDGIDINESSNGGANFTPLRPNPDSLEEFQVVTSGFTAELGRSSGAQVTLVTKSGTNEYRGNLFEFYQTPGAMANSYSNNLLGLARPKSIQHIFGGSLGGPLPFPNFGEGGKIWNSGKDKAFFFVNLQLLRQQQAAAVQRTVYTQTARQGLFRYVRGGRNSPFGTTTSGTFPTGSAVNSSGGQVYADCTGSTPASTPCTTSYNIANNPSGIGIDPTLLAVINTTPLPNDFSVGDGLNYAGFNFLAPTTEKQYDLVMKFDFKIDPKNQFYVRYAQGEQNTISDAGNSGQAPFPGLPGVVDTYRTPKNLAINYRWSPTSSIVNEFLFGYSKYTFFFGTPDFDVPFTFNTITTPGTNAFGNGRGVRVFQFVDNLTWIKSNHTVKGGINFRLGLQTDDRSSVGGSVVEGNINFLASINNNFTAFGIPSPGSTSINSNDAGNLQSQINNYLGRVGNYNQAFVANPDGQTFAPAGTRWLYQANYGEYDFYVQDTWRLRPNFVVDLGVRWEPKLTPTSDGLPILRPNQPTTLGSPASNTLRWVEGPLFEDDWNNFSPSLGFAWDPFSNGKTSIRANYRLSYDRAETHLFGQNIFQNSPGNNTTFPTDDNYGRAGGLYRNLPPIIPTGTPLQLRQPLALGTTTQTVIAPDIQFPTVHQWYAGVQRELGFINSVLEVNYIGKRGLHLFGGYNANQVKLRENGFLDAFKELLANQSVAGYQNAYFNRILAGDSRIGTAGTPTRMLLTNSTFTNFVALGSVAGLANSLATTGNRVWIGNTGNPFFFQNYPQFGQLTVIDSNDTSTYHGLELVLKKRFSKGVSFQLGYTLSKSMDSRSFDPVLTTISTGSGQLAANTPFDNNNRSLNWAWSDFDRRHVVQGSFVYVLPVGRDGLFAKEIPRPLDWVIGGWQLAGNFIAATGRPFTVYGAANTLSQSVVTPANCNNCSRDLGKVIQLLGTNYYFSEAEQSLFSTPAPGEFSNVGRNYFIMPGQYQLDLAMSKKFRLTEKIYFETRIEATNATNTPNFEAPNAVLNATAPFGRIRNSVTNTARRVQFAGKFYF